ncbi:hypothetical protein OS493_001145 [Desmophyllum pertusum]|uniref:Uncharacterized protein n=1 Tax=Desmophyllum pertusum TaxID=174260 RepID=A0A9W9ZTZ8_9CNID|nr:hypothetical protein OS493_001145 [Desmophyllum pertusum]
MVLVGDERSMFGRTMLGWMEQHMRYGMNKGSNSRSPGEAFLSLSYLEMMSSYLPPPSNHGRLVWTGFDTAAELTQIIRQADSEQQLRDVLMSIRSYSTTPEQVQWLQKFQWHNLRRSHGEDLLRRMDEQGLFVFPTHRLEWNRNKVKLLDGNKLPNYPVAKIKSTNNGRHAQKADSNKAGGLLPLLYLCRDSKVMLVANLKAKWGLFNGAVGTVVNILYLDGGKPSDDPPPLPGIVMVRFSSYTGPAFIDQDPIWSYQSYP